MIGAGLVISFHILGINIKTDCQDNRSIIKKIEAL